LKKLLGGENGFVSFEAAARTEFVNPRLARFRHENRLAALPRDGMPRIDGFQGSENVSESSFLLERRKKRGRGDVGPQEGQFFPERSRFLVRSDKQQFFVLLKYRSDFVEFMSFIAPLQ
jgi:hypothetical protein